MAYNRSLSQVLRNDTEYDSPAFKQMVFSHIEYLKRNFARNYMNVDPHLSNKYRGNFYGLLREKNITPWMYWVVAEINGIYDPTVYDGKRTQLLVPPENEIRLLWTRHTSIDSEPR